MYKKQVCVCEENRRICVVLGGSRNGMHGGGVLCGFLHAGILACANRGQGGDGDG